MLDVVNKSFQMFILRNVFYTIEMGVCCNQWVIIFIQLSCTQHSPSDTVDVIQTAWLLRTVITFLFKVF